MRLFHCTVGCGCGSPEALTFSSTGPCTWLLFSALCTVQVDIVLPLQVHDEGSCPWGCYRALWLLIANAAIRSCAWELESSKVKWYAWLTGVCLCCGTQTISLWAIPSNSNIFSLNYGSDTVSFLIQGTSYIDLFWKLVWEKVRNLCVSYIGGFCGSQCEIRGLTSQVWTVSDNKWSCGRAIFQGNPAIKISKTSTVNSLT